MNLKEGLDILNCCINLIVLVITCQFTKNNFKGCIFIHFPYLLFLSEWEQFLDFSMTGHLRPCTVFPGYLFQPCLICTLWYCYTSVCSTCVCSIIAIWSAFSVTVTLYNSIGSCSPPTPVLPSFMISQKKIHLLRSVTACYRYLQHINLMLLQFFLLLSLDLKSLTIE